MKMAYKFQKLTPISTADITMYEEALDFIFSDNELRNIAISGSYGAGKSSVLESYKQKHQELRLLHISLAQFNNSKISVVSDGEIKQQLDEKRLEGKIINQLIHQIDKSAIPLTNFRRKGELNKWFIGGYSFLIVLWIMLLFFIFNFYLWEEYLIGYGGLFADILSISLNRSMPLIAGSIVLFLAVVALYKVMLYQRTNGWIKKINIADNSIELFDEQDESLLDRYLDEILYIIKKLRVDAIVFEDIDRYKSIQIFQQLREINQLVNVNGTKSSNSGIIGWVKQYNICGFTKLFYSYDDKPLKFLYLLKDDMFVSKERTKFFDFILPIVPVINSSNSLDKIIEIFDSTSFDVQFLQDVSLYIDDMRLLKNIANEYYVYSKIMTTEQNANKLLAMIIYKNIFPKDFSSLQLNQGFVYNLFAQKTLFVKSELDTINNKIEKLKIENESMESVWQNSKEDVEFCYNRKIQGYVSFQDRQNLEKEKLDKIKWLEARKSGAIDKNIKEIRELEGDREKITFWPLSKIITRENIDSIFKLEYTNELGITDNFDDIKGNVYFPLIKYLIRNGYIDETYADYMTYFYANSICLEDKVFLRSITDQNKKEYTYALRDPNKIVAKLSDRNYKQDEILNFDLLDFLLASDDSQAILDHIHDMLQQVIDTRNEEFIFQFLSRGKNVPNFIRQLNGQWETVMKYLCNSTSITERQKEQYILETLHASEDDELFALNIDNVLTDYISQNAFFLAPGDIEYELVADKMDKLSVKFKTIVLRFTSDKMLKCVYERNLYQLSFSNICALIEKYYNVQPLSSMRQRNYSIIMSKRDEPLVEYVSCNLNAYMNIILAECQKVITDDAQFICLILNEESIDEHNKIEYISYLRTKVEKLTDVVEKRLWNNLLHNDAVKYSSDNMLIFIFEKSDEEREVLFKYLNKHVDEVQEENWKIIIDSLEEEQQSQLFDIIIKANELDDRIYHSILESLNYYYDGDPSGLSGLDADKINILIELDIIIMSDDTLKFMRSEYGSTVTKFICQNVKDYSEKISSNLIVTSEILAVLEDDISLDDKLLLLRLIPGVEISLKNKEYGDRLTGYIIKNNFCLNDLNTIISKYDGATEDLRETIIAALIRFKEEIIEQKIDLPVPVAIRMLPELTEDDKWELFAYSLPQLSHSQCIQFLELFEENETKDKLKRIFYGKHPKFAKTEINKKILDIFAEKKWISTISEKNKHYIAYGKRNDEIVKMLDDQ